MSATTSQGVYLARRSADFGAESLCSSTIDCALVSITDQLALAFGVGLLGFVIATALMSLPIARECCAEERRRTRWERDAFDRFARAVSAVETADPQRLPAATVGADLVTNHTPSDLQPQIKSIQNAYRETIMSVPHYTEEYAEPIQVNMATELGEEITIAIFETHQFTPPLKRILLKEGINARDRRTELLRALNGERDALNECEKSLTALEDRVESLLATPRYDLIYDELIKRHYQLESCRADCEELLRDRQSQRINGHAAQPHSLLVTDLYEYLYQSLPVTYPVLNDGTQLLKQNQTALHRTEAELTYRG